ncbi:SDH family Clp fold serine proteinase [Limnochorda pilosa]|uniref:Serine protease n=1 Tax=Limnochorda pilosa TaxID=1555112 RepID=A0A0K2SN32_LIMPI|nr:ATP-dependent Clp protease proteolytic subunit [Limnochorda pilosa]BAS28525.1 hypothetical protein LIP_2695 [Limnochorda pilosa]
MDVFSLFWLVLILFSLWPVMQQQRIQRARLAWLRRVQRRTGGRVITLIHRQEGTGLLALLGRRFITIEDSEKVLRAIRATPPEVPIDLILHTPGGLVLAAEQIAHALRRHPARVRVMVPHYAMSGGTLIALAADEIWMDENAVLGPVDPQLGNYPAASLLRAVARKGPEKVDDQTLILADLAGKAVHQVAETVAELVAHQLPPERVRPVARALSEGRWTHDFPITCDMLREMGFRVHCELPDEVYQLMELYPQPDARRPSVQYVPQPEPLPQGARD